MGEAYCSSSVMEDSQGSRFSSALGGSVSFGRFLSESLDWGKWSSFSQNRYLEDAQKHSVPGGVAQKKAFFEARYKRAAAKRSAAALEHACASIHEAELDDGSRNQDQVSDPVAQSCNWSAPIVTSNIGEADQFAFNTAIDSNSSEDNSSTEIVKFDKSDEGQTDHSGIVVSSSQLELPTSVDDKENQNKVSEFELPELRVHEKQPLKENFIANHRTPVAVVPKQKIPTPKQSPLRKRSRSSSQPSKVPTPLPPEPTVRRMKKTSCNLNITRKFSTCTNDKNQTPSSSNVSSNLPQFHNGSGSDTTLKAKRWRTTERTKKAKVATEAPELSNGLRNLSNACGRGVMKHDSTAAQSQKRHAKCTPIKGCKDSIQIASSSVVNRNHTRTDKEKILSNARHKSDLNERRKLRDDDAPKKSDESEPKKLRESFCFKARPLPAFYKSIDHTSNRTKVTKTKPQSPDLARINKTSDQKVLSSLKQSFAKASSSTQQTKENRRKYASSSVTLSRNKFN